MLDAILAGLRAQPSRTGSLIITLYGDAIAPRGGALWLGTLLALFRGMGVADGVVRTAVSRLAAEGWLARNRVGRRSFYRLADRGERETRAATTRIYGSAQAGWNGRLRLALIEPGSERETLRQTLAQGGFGTVGPGLMVAPDAGWSHEDAAGLLTMTAEADAVTLQRLARRAWPLDDLAARYGRFIDTFALPAVPQTPEAAMIARMVLIDAWRRAVLRDPLLPAELLPPDWPGRAARQQAAALYEALYPAAEQWLDAYGVAETGALPPVDPGTRRRFASS